MVVKRQAVSALGPHRCSCSGELRFGQGYGYYIAGSRVVIGSYVSSYPFIKVGPSDTRRNAEPWFSRGALHIASGARCPLAFARVVPRLHVGDKRAWTPWMRTYAASDERTHTDCAQTQAHLTGLQIQESQSPKRLSRTADRCSSCAAPALTLALLRLSA